MDPRALIVVAGIAAAASMQGSIGESNAERRKNDFRYTPDPRVMRVVAGGDRSTFADAVWLSLLPDMAQPFNDRALKKRWLAAATETITDLEPSFGTVYSYGAAHLTLIDRNPDEAIKLLSKGIEKNPDSAGLHVTLAMVYYEYKKDRAKTIELLEKASTMPDIDSLSLAMLASMKVDAHDDFMAIAVWAKAVDDAPNVKARTISTFELWRTKRLIANRASRDYQAAHDKTPPKTAEDVRDPKLMDPKVFDVVLTDLVFDSKGVADYPQFDALEIQVRIYQAEDTVAAFREGEGRAPTEEEFRKMGPLPDPPAGKQWKYADGVLSLVDK